LLTKASRRNGLPETRPLDGRAAQEAARKRDHEAHGTPSSIGQVHYVPHMVAPEQRGVKRGTRPMWGCHAFAAAPAPLVGSARRPMRKKRPRVGEEGAEGRPAAALFSSLAAYAPSQTGATAPARPPKHTLRHNRPMCSGSRGARCWRR
jgi:hypothetical protein